MIKKLLLLINGVFLAAGLGAQTNLVSHDFTGENNKGNIGGTIDTAGVNWWINTNSGALSAATDYFAVQNEVFEARDVDGDVFWYSDTVMVSGFSALKISIDAGASGDFEASSDLFTVILHMDGVPYPLFEGVVDENATGDPMLWNGVPLSGLLQTFDTTLSLTGNVVSLEVLANNNAGTENYFFDNIRITGTSAVTPDVTIKNIFPQIVTATVQQGARDHLLHQVKLYSTNNQPVTVSGADFTSGGSYTSGDVEAFNLYYSTDSVFDAGTDVQLQNLVVPGTAGNKTFSGFSQTVAAGDTGYFFITADMAPGATAGNDVNAGTQSFTYQATVNETNLSTNGGLQTIQSVTPDVTLSSRSSMMGGPLFDTATFSPIYRFKLNVSTAAAELDTLKINLNGTYTAGDVSTMRLYQSSDSILDPSVDLFLDTNLVLNAPGMQTFAEFVNLALIAEDDSAYYFVTVDGICAFNAGNTISVNAITTSDLKFTTTVSKSGSASAGGTYTLTNGTPSDATSLMATVTSDSSAVVSWNAPVGCVDSVLVAVKNGIFTAAQPMPNSTYKMDTCFMQGDMFDGGYVVYRGMSTMVNVGCLDSGVTYAVKIWSFNGDSVSDGVTTTVTPIADPGKPTTADAWINEFHYDNAGSDDDEWAEIVVKDTNIYSLRDFSIVLYNGSGGSSYSTLSSADEVTDTSGYIIVAYKQSGSIQNGPDGLALVYQDSIVIQFLSYEGTFLASDGAASGITSIDIGVIESGSTLLGESLQLQGTGTEYSDFTWAEDIDTTWGEINENQYFGEVISYIYNGTWSPADPSGVATAFDTIKVMVDSVKLTASTDARYAYVASGAGLRIGSGFTLSVADSLVIDADGFNDYGQVIGDVDGTTMWQSVLEGVGVNSRWFNVGIPVNVTVDEINVSSGMIWTLDDAPSDNVNDTNQTNIWFYDTDSLNPVTDEGLWRPLADGNIPADSTGWSIFLGAPYFGNLPVNMSVKGEINNGQLFYEVDTFNVDSAQGGYNFLPNPYPSVLDWNAFQAANSSLLGMTYFIFDDGQDNIYVGYNSAAGTPPSNATEVRQVIAPGQAFFIYANDPGQVEFNNSQRLFTDNPPSLFSQSVVDGIFLIASQSNNQSDYAYVGFEKGLTDAFNFRYDGKKIRNTARGVPNISVELQKERYMYKFVEKSFVRRSIPLRFESQTQQQVTIDSEFRSIDPKWTVIFEDLQTGSITNLRYNNYTFNHLPGSNPNRFLLHIDQVGVGLAEERAQNIISYFEAGDLVLDMTRFQTSGVEVQLFNVNGQLIYSGESEGGSKLHLPMSNHAKGVYILRVEESGQSLLNRKVIKY